MKRLDRTKDTRERRRRRVHYRMREWARLPAARAVLRRGRPCMAGAHARASVMGTAPPPPPPARSSATRSLQTGSAT